MKHLKRFIVLAMVLGIGGILWMRVPATQFRGQDSQELTSLVHGLNCHINLIPVNPVKERDFVQPDRSVVQAFKNKLEKNGVNVTIRREMGRDIDGACGQLRRSYLSHESQ